MDFNKYNKRLTFDQKKEIISSPEYSEEKFYRYKFGWGMIFPELSDQELEELAWCSFIH